MNLSRSRPSKLELESIRLPLIALIDVVLFLLLYFIIAGSMAGEEAELGVSLGTAGAGSASNLQPQVLMIDMPGGPSGTPRYRMGTRSLEDRKAVAGLLEQLPKEMGLIIRSAPEAPFEAIAAAVQIAKDSGFTKVSYVVGDTK